MTAGRWHHVAVTLDGGGYRMYLDGAQAATSPATQSILASPSALTFGSSFRGAIDDVTIYDRALTGAQVSAASTAAGTGKCTNTAPVAVDDALASVEDSAKQIPASSLIANDSDPDGDALDVVAVTGGAAAHGTVSLTAGTVTYTPAADYNGPATFDYTLSDGHGSQDGATVTIAVAAVNDPPHAFDDAKTTVGRALTFPAADLATNDSPGPSNESAQALTVTKVTSSAATHGTASLTLGSIAFTADAGYGGDATFGYEVCDDGATVGTADPRCDDGVVTVTVQQTATAPVASDVAVTTDEDDAKDRRDVRNLSRRRHA